MVKVADVVPYVGASTVMSWAAPFVVARLAANPDPQLGAGGGTGGAASGGAVVGTGATVVDVVGVVDVGDVVVGTGTVATVTWWLVSIFTWADEWVPPHPARIAARTTTAPATPRVRHLSGAVGTPRTPDSSTPRALHVGEPGLGDRLTEPLLQGGRAWPTARRMWSDAPRSPRGIERCLDPVWGCEHVGMIAGVPANDAATVPECVARLAKGRRLRVVWRNELGGITFEMDGARQRSFVKWQPSGGGIDLVEEAERLAWAYRYARVPGVVARGSDEDGTWLVTTALPGESAVSDRWSQRPVQAVRAVGAGLRALHDALPVKACAFSWSAMSRVAAARRRAGLGLLQPARWHPEHRRLSVDDALELVEAAPPVDHLVVCHGDACAPNTLIAEDGTWSGHVDFGSLGVADRWADLAVATWSTVWNYGPSYEAELLVAYGIDPDPERIRYYRLLWDLGP